LAFSYWTDKPWFLTEGKLLLCSSYLPLGVPNWSVIHIYPPAPSVIITEAAEENNDNDNLVVDTQGNNPRSNSGKEKEKIYVSTREWRIIMSAINHGIEVPANSRMEVLMGYQYALHQHKKKLRAEKSELRKSQESSNASSRPYWSKYSETSDSSKERHREPKHNRRKIVQAREEKHARSISAPLSDEETSYRKHRKQP
jgi:hypothetical protein